VAYEEYKNDMSNKSGKKKTTESEL